MMKKRYQRHLLAMLLCLVLLVTNANLYALAEETDMPSAAAESNVTLEEEESFAQTLPQQEEPAESAWQLESEDIGESEPADEQQAEATDELQTEAADKEETEVANEEETDSILVENEYPVDDEYPSDDEYIEDTSDDMEAIEQAPKLAADETGMTWADLQLLINEGGEITLTDDVTASVGSVGLTIPSNRTVTLNLNGFTINRNLESPQDNGSVIIVNGNLTINGPGTITGGNTTSVGGGIRVKKNGSLTLGSATVSNNTAQNHGGGIYVSGTGSSFTLNGGTISGNTAKNGGGVAQNSTGSISIISGTITGNTASVNGGGVWFGGGSSSFFDMSGGTITGNTAGEKGGGVYLNSDSYALTGGTVNDNTAASYPDIGTKSGISLPTASITVDTSISYGTVTADKETAVMGETVTLTVSPDIGYTLRSLTVTDANGNPVTVTNNTFTMPQTNVTVTAVFGIYQNYFIDYDYNSSNGNLSHDIYEASPGDIITLTAEPFHGAATTLFKVLAEDDYSPREYTVEIPDASRPDPNTLKFTMPAANVKVFVEFTDLGYNNLNMIFSCEMDGGTVIADKPLAGNDDTVTLTIQPDNGYAYIPDSLRVYEVDDNGNVLFDLTDYLYKIVADSQYSFEVSSRNIYYVSAEFEQLPEQQKYYVMVDDEVEDGSFSVSPELASEGWKVTITATPETYRSFAVESIDVSKTDGSKVNVSSVGNNKYEFIMPADHVYVTGTFSVPSYGITSVINNVPAYEPTDNYIIVDEEAETGDFVDITYVLFPNTVLDSLTVKGDNSGNSINVTQGSHNEGSVVYHSKFTMPAEPVTISLEFSKVLYEIVPDSSLLGELAVSVRGTTVESPFKAGQDSTVTLTCTPPANKLLTELTMTYTLNGRTITEALSTQNAGSGTYTASFKMPSSDVTLSATYTTAADPLTLAVYSTNTQFTASVSEITVNPDKTEYISGESVTVTAQEKDGYNFLGWYEVTGVSGSQVTGYDGLLSSDLSYTFEITESTRITAVYEASGNTNIKIRAVNGAAYRIDGSQEINSSPEQTINVPIGSTLELTAEDDSKVLQWQNETGKILTTGLNLEYYVTSSTTITLVYKNVDESRSYIQFVSDYGQVLSYNLYSGSDSIAFPTFPTKYGYTFEYWVVEGTQDAATEETIRDLIEKQNLITLKPVYTKDAASGTVTVNYKAGEITLTEASVINNIPTGSSRTFTAKDFSGYTFECWWDKNGDILGYGKSYFMQVSGDHELTACYKKGEQTTTAMPVIRITELTKITAGDIHKISCVATRSIPDGYKLIEHGMLYGTNLGALTKDTFIYGTAGVHRGISNDAAMNGFVRLTNKVSSDTLEVYYRGYMIVEDTSSGSQEYLYTEIVRGSYNSIDQ